MRYIRTKDGRIIKIGEQTDVGYEKGTFEVHNKTGIVASYEPIEVLKETNTIEELCDEFVLDHPLFRDNCKCLYHSFEKAKNGIKKRSDNAHNLYDFNIYGAIWTNKGLIYVAKMNEKGELELL